MMLQSQPHANAEFAYLLQMLPALNMEHGPWITGGCARKLWDKTDWHTGDVDVFFQNDQQRERWLHQFDQTWNYTYHKRHGLEPQPVFSMFELQQMCVKKPVPQACVVMETENAITFELHYNMPNSLEIATCKLQVIKVRQAQSLKELWDAFDFNICCFAADVHMVYADSPALADLVANEITPRHNTHSQNFPLRILKHFSQGYHVDDQLLLQAMKQIVEKDVDWCNNY